MRNMFFLLGALLASFVFLTSFSFSEKPQDPPDDKKTVHHVKVIKMKDGKRIELDTLFEGQNIFVWNGDTIGKIEDFEFEMPELPNLDSLQEKIALHFENFEMPAVPDAPLPPNFPQVLHISKQDRENIINLNNPGIISYKKKDKSGGREKITIIREKPEKDQEF